MTGPLSRRSWGGTRDKPKNVCVGGYSHLEATLNCELKSVAEWMKCNRLALSISKTNFILFHSNKLKPNQSLRTKIDDTPITQVDSTKYLGITFDSNLTWKSHINELCLKLSKTVGILSKVRHFVNILVMLYYSLINPFLTYGVHVWGLTFQVNCKERTTCTNSSEVEPDLSEDQDQQCSIKCKSK